MLKGAARSFKRTNVGPAFGVWTNSRKRLIPITNTLICTMNKKIRRQISACHTIRQGGSKVPVRFDYTSKVLSRNISAFSSLNKRQNIENKAPLYRVSIFIRIEQEKQTYKETLKRSNSCKIDFVSKCLQFETSITLCMHFRRHVVTAILKTMILSTIYSLQVSLVTIVM